MPTVADLRFEKGDIGESGGEMAHDVLRLTLPIGGGDATSRYKSLYDHNIASVRRLALVYMVAAGLEA